MSGTLFRGYSTAIEIDATTPDSPWNLTAVAAIHLALSRGFLLGSQVRGRERATLRLASPNVTSRPIGAGEDLYLMMELETRVSVEFSDVSDPWLQTAATVWLPRPVVYRRLYRPAMRSGTRGSNGVRELGLEWHRDPAATDLGPAEWDPEGRISRRGFDPAALHGEALASARRLFGESFTRVAALPVDASVPPDPLLAAGTVLPSILTRWIDVRLLRDREHPVVVAFLLENVTALRARATASLPAPDPASYAPRQLRNGEGIALVADPSLLLEAMASTINSIFNVGIAAVAPPPPPPFDLIYRTSGRVGLRFDRPFTLRPGLPDFLRDMTITFPGGMRGARLQRLDAALVGRRLRLTIRLTDPGDWAGILWGVEAFLDWSPSVSGGSFLWTARRPVVVSSYGYVSPLWWTLGAVFPPFILVPGIIQAVVNSTLASAVTGVATTRLTIPPIGATLVPAELAALLGPLDARRAVLDDLVVSGQLPPPDARAAVRLSDLSAAAGQALDLDTGRVETGVGATRIPDGADLIWWRGGDGLALETGPAAGAALVAADSLGAIRFDRLRETTFAALRLPAARVPRFTSPPPPDVRGLPLGPLLLGVRTTEGRLARCAVWRDAADRLHADFLTYESPAPRLGIPYGRTGRRGVELWRGWSETARAEVTRWAASWRFAFRAAWERLQAPVTVRWFIDSTEVAGRGELEIAREPIVLPEPEPLGARVSYEVHAGGLTVETRTGEAASFQVSAIARDHLGLELRAAVSIAVDGTDVEVGESQWSWVADQILAASIAFGVPYQPPLPPSSLAVQGLPAEHVLDEGLAAGIGASLVESLDFVGLEVPEHLR